MKILVIWRLLTVGGVNAGWRNRAIYFQKYGITTDFLYTKDLGGMHMVQDIATVYLTKDKKEIQEILNKNKYDAIIVVDTSSAYKWLKKFNYQGPIIIEARTPELIKLQKNLQGYEQISPYCFIVPSSYQKRVLSILLDKSIPIKVVHNGTDTSFFRPLAENELPLKKEPHIPSDKKVIAYIGRLDTRKNWRFLLKVAKLVKKERNDIEFWIIGGNKSVEKSLFQEEWKKQGLVDIIKWFPVIPYHDMPSIYGKIKASGGCTISTTKAESFGNTFIESMACGVPVIAPNVSSIPEIVIDRNTGLLYREEHVRGAVQKIYEVIDFPEVYEKLSKESRQHAETKFSLSVCADKYIDMLRVLTGSDADESRPIS